VQVLRNGDLAGDSLRGTSATRYFSQKEADRASVSVGDIVLTSSGECGKVAHVGVDGLSVSNFVKRLRVTDRRVEPRWLYYALRSPQTKFVLDDFTKGTTIKNLQKEFFSQEFLLIPSLKEQHEIVRILDELFSRLDAAAATIAAVRRKANQFRRSLLHAAFTGALTHTGARRMSANLPTKWQSRPLAEVVDDFQSGFASGKHNAQGRGIVHVRPMNVSRNGLLDFAELKFIETEEGHRLCQGDVLFNNTNSPALVGKTAFVDTDRELAFSNHMTRLRVNRKSVDAKFLAIQLHSLWHKGFFKEICSNHVNQASVSTKRLGQVEVVLPSLEEQTEVVRILEEQFSRQEAILASVDSVEQNLDALRRSLLHAAFSGELTKDWRERDRG
jgi:restriction endonuclease S subunit